MNLTFIDPETVLQTLNEGETLSRLAGPGTCEIHVCRRMGTDILVIADTTSGEAVVVEPCSRDHEYGGSVHDHARAILGQTDERNNVRESD